jgi:hypothetical protein
MTLELIRRRSNMTSTVGVLLANGVRVAYTTEPPIKGRIVTKAMREGIYNVALSHNDDTGRLMPYVIGVPQHGAVLMHWQPKDRNKPDECYIRLSETEHVSSANEMEQQSFYNGLIKMLSDAQSSGLVIEILSQDKIDLESDVHHARKRW